MLKYYRLPPGSVSLQWRSRLQLSSMLQRRQMPRRHLELSIELHLYAKCSRPDQTGTSQVDNYVYQHQDIIVPDCAKFSVESDGTKEGTSTSDMQTEQDCGYKVKSTPTPSGGSNMPKSTTSKSPASTATEDSKQSPTASSASGHESFPGSAAKRYPSTTTLLFAFFFGLMLFIPSTQAISLDDARRKAELRARAEVRVRQVSSNVRTFAQQFDQTLVQKANAVGENGETFAQSLVADAISSVCGGFFNREDVATFTPSVVGKCIKSIYGGDALPQPGVQFLAVFGASLLCDYAVSEAFPVAKEFFPEGCEGLQDLTQKANPSATAGPSSAPSTTAPSVSNPVQSASAESVSPVSNPLASVSPPASNALSNPPSSNAPTNSAPSEPPVSAAVPNAPQSSAALPTERPFDSASTSFDTPVPSPTVLPPPGTPSEALSEVPAPPEVDA